MGDEDYADRQRGKKQKAQRGSSSCFAAVWHGVIRLLFAQRGVLEQTKAITLRVAYILSGDAVQIVFPNSVLIDETIGRRFVAVVLDFQNFLEQLADDCMIFVVVNLENAVLESEQAVLQKEIPLHQLHRVVGLIAPRLV